MTTRQPETNLVAMLKNRPTEAFDEIIEVYGSRIYWHIRRIVVLHEEAEDVMQECFVRAFEQHRSFRGETNGSLAAWLYKIATNEALKALARRKRNIFASLDSLGARLAADFDSEISPSADEIAVRLQRAVVQLPVKQKLVFNLRYYDELPFEDIARITGMSLSSAKTNYHYAAQKVKSIVTLDTNYEYEADAL